MLIRLKATYCHDREVDAATVQAPRAAASKRCHFEARIRGSGSDGPFDCGTHPIRKRHRL